MLLIVGIGMALRMSELVGLKVGDVYNGEQVKSYVTIRPETAKNKKERTIHNMLNFNLKDIPTSDLILELQLRGLGVSSIIDQLQEKRVEKEAKVIQFPLRV